MELTMYLFLYLSIIVASVSNAIMDTLAHHFHRSIFSNMNHWFWNPGVSWRNKYNGGNVYAGRKKIVIWIFGRRIKTMFNKPVFLTDAWHLFKSIMITAFIFAIVISPKLSVLDFVMIGIVYNTIFSLFYNRLLIRN